jgi:hypothetical protein
MQPYSRSCSSTGLRRLVLVAALTAALGAMPALAQKSTGDIFGHAAANSSVSLRSVDTGLTREIQSDGNGRFTFGQLPTGRYVVSAGGNDREVTVRVGTGSEVDFVAKDSSQLAAIEVTGNAVNPISSPHCRSAATSRASRCSRRGRSRAIPASAATVAVWPRSAARRSRRTGTTSTVSTSRTSATSRRSRACLSKRSANSRSRPAVMALSSAVRSAASSTS